MKTFSAIAFFIATVVQVCGQEFKQPYYIHVNGDSVALDHKRSFILTEAHPQRLEGRTVNGDKLWILADSIKHLMLDYTTYLSSKSETLYHYKPYVIPTKKGPCTHFMRELYRQGNAVILTSPFCSQCSYMRFYVYVDGKYVGRFTRQTIQSLTATYFNDHKALVEYTKRKRFVIGKVYSILTRK
ncbi:MAG TPA: hypothetical protein VK177_02775 [Flavobacteriales bacterium]|nr:hypothetical protein [Flavobacteriales bacterium]